MDMEGLYQSGRKRWQEDVAEKRRVKREEQAVAHKRAVELQGMQYGEGSPAMIGARSGEQVGKWEWGPGGVRPREATVAEGALALKPYQEAARYDIERRKLQGQGIISGAVPTYKDTGLGYEKTGEQPYILRPAPGGGYEEVQIRRQGEQPMGTAQAPTQYYSPPGAMTQPGQGIPINQPPPRYGGGTMRVEGQPGYYEINPQGGGGTAISPTYPNIRRFGGPQQQQQPEKRKPLDEIFGRRSGR